MTNIRPTRIYAGAGHRLQGADKGRHGGLFRRFVGDGEWELLAAGLPDNVEARAFAVHPLNHDVMYAGTQDGPYRTTDGGDHWQLRDTLFEESLHGVAFADAANGWVVGERGLILHSHDGGLTWEDQPLQRGDTLSAVSIQGRMNAWILGEDSLLLHTKDGGQHWVAPG